MTECLPEALKDVYRESNSNIVRHGDGLLSSHKEEIPVAWIVESPLESISET